MQAKARPQDRLAVIGSEPQLYFYSGLLPATGYIYTYPLMEDQPYSEAMQREMAAEIERTRPRFLVFVNTPLSWLRQENSPAYIFEWYNTLRSSYRLVQAVEIPPKQRSEYYTGEPLLTYSPRQANRILVWERAQ